MAKLIYPWTWTKEQKLAATAQLLKDNSITAQSIKGFARRRTE